MSADLLPMQETRRSYLTHSQAMCHHFDDNFTLMPDLRSNTVPTNWEYLVTKPAESATDLDIDSSKIWFNQNYLDPEDPASDADATFTNSNSTVTPPALPPHINGALEDIDTYSNDFTGSEGVPGSITPPIVSLGRNIASEGDLLTPDAPNIDSEGDTSRPRDHKNSKVKVRFKDAGTSIPRFINLHESGLRRPKSLQQGKLTYDGDDIVYNLFTNFSTKSPMPLSAPVSLLERTLCAQEKSSSLIDNTINQVSEHLPSSIYNDTYHFKDMLRQNDRAEFIKTMETEIDVHQQRNHWELLKYSDMPKGIKPIM